MEVDDYETFQLSVLFWLIALLLSGFMSSWNRPLSIHKDQNIKDKNDSACSTLADFVDLLIFLTPLKFCNIPD